MPTTVTTKGRVTIPKPIRDRLGIQPGNAVRFDLAPNGSVVLVKVAGEQAVSRFAALKGRGGQGLTTDQIMALTRGER